MKTARAADLAHLADLIESFARQTILVLGDFVADEFVFGEISRVSREAPVLILRHRETQSLPGGGANAVNNLAALGARVLPVAAIGDDAAGEALRDYFRSQRVDTSGVQRVRGWTTPAKTRFLAGWTHTARQQVLRMDREPSGELPPATVKTLVREARERIRGASAMVISDYGYGSATPEIVRAILGRRKARRSAGSGVSRAGAAASRDARFALPHARIRGHGARRRDAQRSRSRGRAPHENRRRPRATGRSRAAHYGPHGAEGALVVTRGRDGMIVFERGRAPQALAVFGSDQAVDVTGAGDTVIAAFSLALAAGATMLEAAQVANYAGGLVVMKRGTATVTREELAAAIRSDATGASAAKAADA